VAAGQVTDFTHQNLSGARFEYVYLTGADFHGVDLTDAHFRLVDLTRVTIRGADLKDMDISGQIDNVRINGVDVVRLVEAELDRRYPDRAKMRPGDAAGYRKAWDVLERLWQQTVARARQMDPDLLHRRVNGEWSFTETLRHLVFATDAWVNRAILGQPSPWDPLDLPADELPDMPGIPRDRDVRPSLDQVLALRADRMATVRDVLASLTDEQLAGMTQPVREPGFPSRKPSPSPAASGPSSTRNGSTASTPNATSTPCNTNPADAPASGPATEYLTSTGRPPPAPRHSI
jgi:DinB superfamily/Pentapeptide repeats (8 copies)